MLVLDGALYKLDAMQGHSLQVSALKLLVRDETDISDLPDLLSILHHRLGYQTDAVAVDRLSRNTGIPR